MTADYILTAVEHENRPDSDRQRDQNRKPSEVLDFFKIQTTDKIGEINAGRGYFSSIMAYALQQGGLVYAHTSPMSVERWKGNPIEKRLSEFPQDNLIPVVGEMESPNFPEKLDKIFNVMTYHDSVWTKADRNAMNVSIYQTLKPGGIYGIIDHNSKEGTGIDNCHDIHRIEKSYVIEEVTKAGFYFEDESGVLNNPQDSMDLMVFDKSIRDQTSRFILVFKKS